MFLRGRTRSLKEISSCSGARGKVRLFKSFQRLASSIFSQSQSPFAGLIYFCPNQEQSADPPEPHLLHKCEFGMAARWLYLPKALGALFEPRVKGHKIEHPLPVRLLMAPGLMSSAGTPWVGGGNPSIAYWIFFVCWSTNKTPYSKSQYLKRQTYSKIKHVLVISKLLGKRLWKVGVFFQIRTIALV